MKDYSMSDQERKKYITDFRCVENENGEEVYEVVFADDQVFTGIKMNRENFDKIEQQMERQANDGVARISTFISRKNRALGTMVAGVASLSSASVLAMNSAAFMGSQPIDVLPTTLGVVGVFALVKGGVTYIKTAPKVKELNKLKYLQTHKKTLSKYNDYYNALGGLSNKKREYFEELEEPFLMVDIDDYSEEDLHSILENINREKEFQFTYGKRLNFPTK